MAGRGVDLNRNWSVDWGKKEKVYNTRLCKSYFLQFLGYSHFIMSKTNAVIMGNCIKYLIMISWKI